MAGLIDGAIVSASSWLALVIGDRRTVSAYPLLHIDVS